MSIREDQARPRRTCCLFHFAALWSSVAQGTPVGQWSSIAQGSPVSSWGRHVCWLLWWNRTLKAPSVLKGVSPSLSSFWSLRQFLWIWRPRRCHQLSQSSIYKSQFLYQMHSKMSMDTNKTNWSHYQILYHHSFTFSTTCDQY